MEGADVGLAGFVQQKIPGDYAPRPVTQYRGEATGPLDPVGRIIWIGNFRPPFGPIAVLRGERLFYTGHRVGSTCIAVPCDSIDVFVDFRVAEFIDCPAPKV